MPRRRRRPGPSTPQRPKTGHHRGSIAVGTKVYVGQDKRRARMSHTRRRK